MTLHDRLARIVEPLPPGAAVTLPADVVRAWLEKDGGAGELRDLTVEALAGQLDRAPSTVRTWCASGRIPGAYRLRGREWRIPAAGLRDFLEAQAGPREGPRSGTGDQDLGSWRRHLRPAG